jgi:hypothetical protein
VFSDYLEAEEARAGVAAGRLFMGRLRQNPRSTRVAYVTPEATAGLGLPLGLGMDIMIEGPKDRNRALEGDVVVVQLHPPKLWVGNKRRDGGGNGNNGNRNGDRNGNAKPMPTPTLEGAMAGACVNERVHVHFIIACIYLTTPAHPQTTPTPTPEQTWPWGPTPRRR